MTIALAVIIIIYTVNELFNVRVGESRKSSDLHSRVNYENEHSEILTVEDNSFEEVINKCIESLIFEKNPAKKMHQKNKIEYVHNLRYITDG